MIRSVIFALPPFLIAFCCVLTDACTTTYVRVPAVCPRDALCLDERPDAGPDGAARERAFVRRHAEATVDVRGTRYLSNRGSSSRAGIGALVSPKGYVLTAYHLIDAASAVTVTLRTSSPDGGLAAGREMPAMPLAVSREADLALLIVPSDERLPPSLPVRHGPVIAGDRSWFIGAGPALKRGVIAETGIAIGLGRYAADAAIAAAPEDAGAPLLNVCGEVIGVAAGPYGRRGRLRFIPIDDALRLLSVTPADLR